MNCVWRGEWRVSSYLFSGKVLFDSRRSGKVIPEFEEWNPFRTDHDGERSSLPVCLHLLCLSPLWHWSVIGRSRLVKKKSGFPVSQDNLRVRSVFQQTGMKGEESWRRPVITEQQESYISLTHQHSPLRLQTPAPRPFNSTLAAMHIHSEWTCLIRSCLFPLTLTSPWLWVFFSLPVIPFPSFPCLGVSALIPTCCCHSAVTLDSQSFSGVNLVSLLDFYHHRPNTAGRRSEARGICCLDSKEPSC